MITAVTELIPKKLLKKGLTTELYEGSFETNRLQLTLRETLHLQPEFIPRSLVTFFNVVAALPPEHQMLMLRLMLDVIGGREVKLVELDGERLLYFPDIRGDADHDLFLMFASATNEPDTGILKAPKSKPERTARQTKKLLKK